MRFLSFDLETTGLEKDALLIEFAAVPFDSTTKAIENTLSFHTYIKCPSFNDLKPKLNPWVIEHNEQLITKAHQQGIALTAFKDSLAKYLESPAIKQYFGDKKIFLFGKSMSALDFPVLERDLGYDYFRKYFHHHNLDLTCFALGLIDLGFIPEEHDSGTKLMKYFNMGDVCHTALEDALNTITLYFKLIERFGLTSKDHLQQ